MQVKKGDRISLNLKKRNCYFQGSSGINLSAKYASMVIIPSNINDANLEMINKDIALGNLIAGWPNDEKKQTIDPFKYIEDLLGLSSKKVRDYIYELKNDKTISSKEKSMRLEKMIELESLGKNSSKQKRSSIISAAESALSSMGGVSPVVEEEVEKVDIEIVSGQ